MAVELTLLLRFEDDIEGRSTVPTEQEIEDALGCIVIECEVEELD